MDPIAALLQRALRHVAEREMPVSATTALQELLLGDRPDGLAAHVARLSAGDLRWVLRYLALSGRIARLTRDDDHDNDPADHLIDNALARYETPVQLSADLAKLHWVPVFTLHPSEIIPGPVLDQLAFLIRDAAAWRLTDEPAIEALLMERLAGMLRQDAVASVRPTVDDEVDWLIRVFERTVFSAVSAHFTRLEQAARHRFGTDAPGIPTYLRFHSWVGGDRDGNPNVTPAATRRATDKMRQAVLLHYRTRLADIIENASPDDQLRAMLAHIEARLYATANRQNTGYRNKGAMRGDIRQALIAAEQAGDERSGNALWQLLRLCDVFGLHLASLHWRQDSMVLREVLQDLGEQSGTVLLPPDAEKLLSERSRDLVESLRALTVARQENGADCIAQLILANTGCAEDILALARLAHECGVFDQGVLPVVPLFETLDKLQAAPQIMRALLNDRSYREDLAAMDNRAEIMLGYSDSAKDGGRLAADIAVYRAETELRALFASAAPEIALTIFHGRGGSLGRGVATAAQAISLCPPNGDAASLKQTEQGESLSRFYGDGESAATHMDRSFAALLQGTRKTPQDAEDAAPLLQALADEGARAYRALTQHPGFIDFLSNATALPEIVALPITSRPARRHGMKLLGLENLRAVSYNFAFNQTAAQVPAWYGTGTALETFLAGPQAGALHHASRSAPLSITLDRAKAAMMRAELDQLARNAADLLPVEATQNDAAYQPSPVMTLIQAEWDRMITTLAALGLKATPKPSRELLIALAAQSILLRQNRARAGGDAAPLRDAIAAVAAWMDVTG